MKRLISQTLTVLFRTLVVVVLLACFSFTATAQPTYTNNELVASAPLSWQVQHDPASRLVVGPDDGNAIANAHASLWASAIRYGGAQGLEGLLYDFTVSTEGAPTAFGLARSGCVITDETSLDACMLVRWTPVSFDRSIMRATIIYPNLFSHSILEHNVQPGESFSIERLGNATINFYRSTGVAGQRRRVVSVQSPFSSDGYPSNTPIEARAVFGPDSTTRKLSLAQEIYYCCL